MSDGATSPGSDLTPARTIRFWVDPICPWCWVTAMWARQVAPHRNLVIEWRPISLMFKNQPEPGGTFYDRLAWSLGLLRVMEAVGAGEGSGPIEELYLEYGRRIHHDGERLWDVKLASEAVGLDPKYAEAFDDDQWDLAVQDGMEEGLALVGTDVGTPIIALDVNGTAMATFGPVITRVPPLADSLRLWDAFETMTTLDGFWELKRTRTERPEFPRPPLTLFTVVQPVVGGPC